MKKIFKELLPYFVIFIISAVFIYPYCKKGFILAMGESTIYLNPFFNNFYSIWEEKLKFGSFNPNQTLFFLSNFLKFLQMLPLGIHSSIVFIFLSFFLPSVFFYYCVSSIIKEKYKISILCGSILYSFNIFRSLGALNEGQNILFISLPLFFLFYYKLLQTKKWLYVFIIVLISVFSSTLGANLPLFIIPCFIMFLSFIYYFITNHFKIEAILIIQNLTLFLLILIVNLFWLFPVVFFYTNVFLLLKEAAIPFTTFHTGNFYDHFRFIGLWAWREKHNFKYYYPYAPFYDGFFMAFSTYIIAIFSFVFFIKKNKNYLENLIFFILVVSYILLSGTKGPIGFIYKFLFDNFVFFKIYRDPFMKFTPIYIFAVSLSLVLSISYIKDKINNKFLSFIVFLGAIFFILINAYPLFNQQALPIRTWNGGQSSYVMKIPEYWKEAKSYIEKSLVNERLSILPFNNYSTSHNWEYGANVVGNIADFILDVPNVKPWGIEADISVKVVNLLYNTDNKNLILAKSLGIFNSRYILQENDVEWRYSGGKITPPSITTNFIEKNGFKKVAEFGKLTKEYLSRIPNYEQNKQLHDELYKELVDKPALILYKMDDKYFIPHIYIPKKVIITSKSINNFPDLIARDDFVPQSAIFFQEQNTSDKTTLKEGIEIYNQSELNFKKINSTKYLITVKSVKSIFPIIFSESFHPGWEIKYGNNVIEGQYHFMANGYANSWFMEPKKMCGQGHGYCTINADDSYNLSLVLEFSAQKYLNISFIISGVVSFICFLYIVITLTKPLIKNYE